MGSYLVMKEARLHSHMTPTTVPISLRLLSELMDGLHDRMPVHSCCFSVETWNLFHHLVNSFPFIPLRKCKSGGAVPPFLRGIQSKSKLLISGYICLCRCNNVCCSK